MKIKMMAATVSALILGAFSTAKAADTKAEMDTLAKTYPLQTCIVSDEKLGGMGAPHDILYKETVNGKETDRLVRFCCKGCVKDFEKDPAKYMSKLNDAVAKKS